MSASVHRGAGAGNADSVEARRGAGPTTLIPGISLAAAIAVVATILGRLVPVAGAPVIAILIGVLVSLVWKPSSRLSPGIAFTSKKVLQGSVVLLGLGLSLGQLLSVGGWSLPVLIGTLTIALSMASLVGRSLGLDRNLRTLVGVGTAVCGASAIAATNAVIDADEADVSYAIATIFTFNVVAVLSFPAIGHGLGFTARAFGLWSGTAINDLSSVIAAATVYGNAAASYAVIVKLTRTLAIIPICFGLAAFREWRREGVRRLEVRHTVPLFIGAFLGAVVVNTLGLVPATWHRSLSDFATWMITGALAAIGLSTDLGEIGRVGVSPLVLGGILWITVGIVSIGLQVLSGTV